MTTSKSDLFDLSPYFSVLDATPPDYPGQFQFFIPNNKAYRRWPQYPSAASPERGRAAAGRGLDSTECMTSGLGEAIELASVCAWGTEDFVHASQNELGASAIPANAVLGLSAEQYAGREKWNSGPLGKLDWRPHQHDPDRPIDWIQARNGPHSPTKYVPADLVLVGRREKGDPQAVAIATTSGCAAGTTLADAKRRALLELLERDAIGCWWYGGKPASPMPLDLLQQEQDLFAFLRQRGRTTTLFNISTDLCQFVVAAASWSRDHSFVALGFSAATNRTLAARGAVIELLQTEIGLSQRLDAGDPLAKLWVNLVNADTAAFRTLSRSGTAVEETSKPVSIKAAGFSPIFVDLSRAAFAIPVVRAIIPGLACDKPRVGTQRFYDNGSGMKPPLLV